MRKEIIELIFKIAKEKDAFDTLEKYLSRISRQDLSENLIDCGILPEMFAHDSSEEKLWAKFSDILLAKSLNFLGIEAEVLGARGNSADVFGRTTNYTIVGDAKTFRLSRTAKNQKDFKVNALDTWRKGDNYALLLAPLTQFPNTKSQIYSQSIEKNVTLVSYTHFHFLLDFYNGQNLQTLWETGNILSQNIEKSDCQKSENYWSAIDIKTCELVGQNLEVLAKYKKIEIEKTKEIGKEGITFWQNKIAEFQKLTKDEAIRLLIKSEKIEAKIKTIEKAIKL
ncbi:MAG: HindIII family type II restriction endonuclease [Pyrinomonadaceae bacterium]|nr:HindIII family type II restriction endonuclease [Pyrinomonadaceae bacterium]